MSYRSLARWSLFLACLLIGAACSRLVDSDSPADEAGGLLKTDRATYKATLVTDEPAHVAVDIPYALTNATQDTLYLIGCHRPPQPVLQKYADGSWTTVYAPVELMCLSPPWPVAPGAVRLDTLRVRGFLPGQNAGPVFEAAEVEGTYRLVRPVYRDPAGAELLPEAQRVSNSFALRAK